MPTKKDPASKTSVYKFGGTSVGTAEDQTSSVDCVVIRRRTTGVGKLSAMGGVTDKLLLACQMASNGNGVALEGELKGILTRHIKTLEDLLPEMSMPLAGKNLNVSLGRLFGC